MTTQQKLPEIEEIKDYLKSFDFFDKYVHNRWEADFYADAHARRFKKTLEFMPPLAQGARVLELGAVPYYMTCLLIRFLKLKVDTLSFYEVEEANVARHTIESVKYGEHYDFEYRAINVERDLFPFADETYDLVLCCEILEHLLINPSHMLYESHRVLRPDGYMLLTTPNVLQWRNVISLLKGRNIYDHYRGNGIYGRHNREYTPAEVATLLEANGLALERLETVHLYGSPLLNRIPRLFDNRRDNIFALARRQGRMHMALPETLYLLVDEYRNVARSSIQMGVNEIGQIGQGWHEFESGGPGFRWTLKKAQFYLKNTGAQNLWLRIYCHHPEIAIEPVQVTLLIDGAPVGVVSLTDYEWHDYGFELEDKYAQSVLRCELMVSRTWIPERHGSSGDSRELGVAVSRAWLC